jgi:hypothetical protein
VTRGGTFAAPLAVVGRQAGGVRHPAVGVDARGGAVVAYQAGIARVALRQGGRIEVALRRSGAGGFGRPLVSRGRSTPPGLRILSNALNPDRSEVPP